MLPIVLFNNMEGSSGNNQSFGQLYDENVILNCVRSRKKVTELPNCPVCSCTIRQGELETHLALEVERLQKLSCGGTKRKISVSSNLAVPGSSTSADVQDEQEVDVSGCPGSDVYQRVHTNRLRRLRARRRSPPPADGECPVCNTTLPISRLQRHALRCLKRTGASMDEDVPDTSSEEGSIDVENDEPASGFGAEYQWCGEWRVRAAALQPTDARVGTCVRRVSNDQALVVDGDEDTELYGPAQYSPSRIAPEAEIPESSQTENNEASTENDKPEKDTPKPNGIVEASAETRIQALKAKIKDLEKKNNGSAESKCLICLGPYVSPAVSIQCWHVYCESVTVPLLGVGVFPQEGLSIDHVASSLRTSNYQVQVCWLQSLRAKKICPQCNAITTSQHLRRIYM